jgi:hypothetical protein
MTEADLASETLNFNVLHEGWPNFLAEEQDKGLAKMMQSNISEGLMHDIISHSISETDGTPCSH